MVLDLVVSCGAQGVRVGSWACVSVDIYMCVYVCAYVYEGKCVSICVSVYMCVCMHMYMYYMSV